MAVLYVKGRGAFKVSDKHGFPKLRTSPLNQQNKVGLSLCLILKCLNICLYNMRYSLINLSTKKQINILFVLDISST